MLISFTFPASLFYSSSHISVAVEDVAGLRAAYVVDDELGIVRGFLLRWHRERKLGLALTRVLRDLCNEPTAPILQVRSVESSTVWKIRTSYEGDAWPPSSV